MASRTAGKGSQSTAGTSKQRAGRSGTAAKKAPAKKAAARPAGRAPARRAPAKKTAPKSAPRRVGRGMANGVGAMFRGVGRGAKGLHPAHRKDGLALLLLALALIVAAGTWSDVRGPVGDLVKMLVTGAFGRLDVVVPILLAFM